MLKIHPKNAQNSRCSEIWSKDALCLLLAVENMRYFSVDYSDKIFNINFNTKVDTA